ncbi:hypothetical protein A2858_03260 [Candidatus Daviesbacteria bacterium RIFCSPHIGHO2_01_FULL_36_37]|uniref:Uncharacterized protein n=2 Tax=Candidatus Daviesiibacteriota TaxID=1752718 RepID=A0A1F5K5S8_9BACT|nr:MAG: hypothetical protein A2858_03260 [Candidatus Daviesbacteria bacterium RIFCSPHIGHO2_01_FULL_36_37]OGE32226.1 MAG: hypothetical protein A3C99_02630 [Candidatus Daviesbacteria bacterium RIFCSPHIGHO2_02_FULL_37_9]OGE36292.1 MAG: hypothetical protein A3E66_00125 [Candidatus Daviesbacteria bacterium RIFCSPHIGHO2_12_FULL_37_16]
MQVSTIFSAIDCKFGGGFQKRGILRKRGLYLKYKTEETNINKKIKTPATGGILRKGNFFFFTNK